MRVYSQLRKVCAVEIIYTELDDQGKWKNLPFRGLEDDIAESERIDRAIIDDQLRVMNHEDGHVVWKCGNMIGMPGDWIVWEDDREEMYIVPGNLFGFLFNYRPA